MAIKLADINYTQPSRCTKHKKQMLLLSLSAFDPCSSGGWFCPICLEESQESTAPPTRWPNAGEPGGAEL